MSALFDANQRGLLEAIVAVGDSFVYGSLTIPCIIDPKAHIISTAKSYFTDAAYPPVGATITVAGKKRQVTALANSGLALVAGGFVETEPFVDDPSDPGLEILFEAFNAKHS